MRRIPLLVVALLFWTPLTGGAQSSTTNADVARLLARPISPGAIALLAEHGMTPGVPARLAEALKHPSPSVRAAAARLIFVLGLRPLVSAVSAALMTESDAHAAIEQARVVAYFGAPGDFSLIWDSVARTGPSARMHAAVILAAARGHAALDLLQRLSSGDEPEGTGSTLVRVATQGSRDAIATLASRAIRDRDVALLAATLGAASDVDTAAGEEILASTLAGGELDEIRRAGLRHLVRSWDGESAVSEQLRSVVLPLLNGAAPSDDPEMMLVLEIVSRAMTRPPRADAQWKAFVATPPEALRRQFGYRSVRAMLTDEELQAASRALYRDPTAITPARPGAPRITRPAASGDGPVARVLEGYPPGYVSGVLTEAGCDLRRLRDRGIVDAAELTFRPDGRAQRVAFFDMPGPAGCVAASRALLLAYVADPSRLLRDGTRELLLMLRDDEFVTCQEDDAADRFRANPLRLGGRITPPKKTRDVRPVYPESARLERIQGVVILDTRITRSGCIANASVARSVDSRLDGSALRAVLGWRFAPTIVEGQALPVIMTVTVQFTLN